MKTSRPWPSLRKCWMHTLRYPEACIEKKKTKASFLNKSLRQAIRDSFFNKCLMHTLRYSLKEKRGLVFQSNHEDNALLRKYWMRKLRHPEQPWEYRIEYRWKVQILNLFTVSNSIEYRIINIEYRWYWKSCILRPKTHIFGTLSASDFLPPLFRNKSSKNA